MEERDIEKIELAKSLYLPIITDLLYLESVFKKDYFREEDALTILKVLKFSCIKLEAVKQKISEILKKYIEE